MIMETTGLTNTILAERGKFLIKLADCEEEIQRAQKLRYQVFRAEQGRLHGAGEEIDCDEFDDQFMHLVVLNRETEDVVGTYRMQSGEAALAGRGFYSEGEYRITGLRDIATRTFEVGRSCVAAEYRSGAVISLLWAGISAMHSRYRFSYLIGCASLEESTPELGWAFYDYFVANGLLNNSVAACAREQFLLPEADPVKRRELAADPRLKDQFPPLFKGYLRLGAEIGGEPALDREFGSIDFLVVFDFAKIAARYARHFDVKVEG